MKILDLYITSHENLIIDIYKDELVLLPIKLDTLDFALMTNKDCTDFSELAKDAIQQARYVVKEKLENRENKDKVIYFRVERRG